jgi:arsenate reductase
MAHGYLNHFGKNKVEVYSAGIEAHGVNPRAVQVMKEDGIDLSTHTSNEVSEYDHIPFDYVITVCDHARENCPYLPARIKVLHQNFPDPTQYRGTETEIMTEFRRVREMIKAYIRKFTESNIR